MQYRAAGGSDEKFVGAELDITAKYVFSPGVAVEVGYSRFFTGDFLEDTGTSDDVDFLFAQFMYSF